MKTVIAINGSPRKDYNTAALLREALRGAADAGANTELIHLSDLQFSGCMSCFACKRLDAAKPNQCALRDDLAPILQKIEQADVLLVGSPVYLFDVTGATRCFLERLAFPRISYDGPKAPKRTEKINCGFIFTQNHPLDNSPAFEAIYAANMRSLKVLGGKVERLIAAETYQFDDYSKYACAMFDEAQRRKIRDERFPETLAAAYTMAQQLLADE